MRVSIVLSLSLLFGCAACNDDVPDDLSSLTEGVEVAAEGCPYRIRTPAETTMPVGDLTLDKAGAPRHVHLSWAGDPAESITVVWVTDVATRGTRVELGTDTSYGTTVKGFSFAYPVDLGASLDPSVRVHEVHICGLKPGTLYHYRAGTEGAWSPDATFTTAPAGGDHRPVRFAVAGDSRGNPALWGEVVRAAAAAGAEFIVYSGDAVTFGFLQEEWEDWFGIAEKELRSLPVMFAWGNHEAAARHVAAQFALPGNEQWYGFDYGDIHFSVLNDSPAAPTTIANEQARFLDADLSIARRRWKVAVHHRALFSSSAHASQIDLREAWMPIYDSHGVDLVLNGHDHNYERTKPMRGGAVVPPGQGRGTTYVVNGGGGAPLYAAGTSEFTAFSKSTFGYLLIDVMGDHMKLTAYELAGGEPAQLDQVTLSK